MNPAMRGPSFNNGAFNNGAFNNGASDNAAPMRPGENRQGRAMNPAMRGPSINNGAFNNGAPNNGAPGNDRRGQAFNNDRRGPDNAPDNAMRGQRRDFSAFHRNFNAPQRYRAPLYNRPRGWYSHRWTYGEFLPSLFWAPDYWLNDYMDFGLPPPPPGTVWVRDGSDALLIDRYSGEIIQVAYGVFY
jgi:Ni/Co efflux regulator RcnB